MFYHMISRLTLPSALFLLIACLILPSAAFAQENDGRDNQTPPGPPIQVIPPVVNEGGSDHDDGVVIPADQLILDDLIVDGSLCVGFDCVNGESFGFDTIRLKENNLRIKFQDTSTSASFPTTDWQIRVNDSSNGGKNYFAVEDVSGGRTPFMVEGSAPSNSLYVDDSGLIGFGTATPVVNLHQVNGNTPTLRLEQNGSSGFTAQTWDVAGNEANFFIRDATNGSELPFRIRPGAATSAIDIDPDGVGFGHGNPTEYLHVKGGNALVENGELRVNNYSSDPGDAHTRYSDIVVKSDSGYAGITLVTGNEDQSGYMFGDNASNGQVAGIQYRHDNDRMLFRVTGNTRMSILSNGDVQVGGVVVHSSDRRLKRNIEPITNALEIATSLQGVRYEWVSEDKHKGYQIGLIAQDVEKWIPEVVTTDDDEMGTKSVAYANLVALLVEAVKEQQAIIESQRHMLTAVEARMDSFEETIGRLEQLYSDANVQDVRSSTVTGK